MRASSTMCNLMKISIHAKDRCLLLRVGLSWHCSGWVWSKCKLQLIVESPSHFHWANQVYHFLFLIHSEGVWAIRYIVSRLPSHWCKLFFWQRLPSMIFESNLLLPFSFLFSTNTLQDNCAWHTAHPRTSRRPLGSQVEFSPSLVLLPDDVPYITHQGS